MEIFYRLFYTTFSMSCMAVVLFPVVLVLRFFFRHLPKNLTMALWSILYLRAVCPIGMSSPVCWMSSWNRRFHLLLRSIGLDISKNQGLLTSWREVYQNEIQVSVPYMACTLFWLAGIFGVVLYTMWRQRRFRRWLKADAKHLIDNVYQSAGIASPVRTGLLRSKIYLPEGLSALETKNILLHQQLHGKRKDDLFQNVFFLISCIHWWNPVLWFSYYLSQMDREYACDEAVVKQLAAADKKRYAQDIINMKKEGKKGTVPTSFVTRSENGLSRRGERVLYMGQASVWKKGLGAFLVTMLFFSAFGLSALYRGDNGTEDASKETLFDSTEKRGVTQKVIASCDTQTPDGTDVRLELMITQGTYQKGVGYEGQCSLRLVGSEETALASITLSKVFGAGNVQQFGEDMKLSLADYNEDGTMELAIGQRMEVDASKLSDPASGEAVKEDSGEKETVNVYYIIDIREDSLKVVSEPVYVGEVTSLQEGSMTMSYVKGAKGVITTRLDDQIAYYVWDEDKEKYTRQTMTQEELSARQDEEEETKEGQETRHTLENEEGVSVMGIDTETDYTGSEVIKKIEINPKGLTSRTGTKGLTDVEGYYCDLQWAQSDGEDERYAVLIYNGTKGRTFVLYDVEETKVCYRQEDGNSVLQELFKKYGEDEVSFDDNGAVVYSLMEISGDNTLKVSFAASAKDNVTVRGTYLYDLSKEKASSLQYTREIG